LKEWYWHSAEWAATPIELMGGCDVTMGGCDVTMGGCDVTMGRWGEGLSVYMSLSCFKCTIKFLYISLSSVSHFYNAC